MLENVDIIHCSFSTIYIYIYWLIWKSPISSIFNIICGAVNKRETTKMSCGGRECKNRMPLDDEIEIMYNYLYILLAI